MSKHMSRPWFQFKDATDNGTTVDIHIIDFIGGWVDDMINRFWGDEIGVTARAFVEQLAALPDTVKTLNVHLNTPGGDVQGGINIANALREQSAKGRTVHTYVDGLAASIGSVIAMAGQKVVMADNALMMVHNPWGFSVGNAAELRKTADVLDTMRGQIIATYQWHSQLEITELEALMDAETWMTADEAIAQGFATDKVVGLTAVAALPQQALASLRVPEQHRARVAAFVEPDSPPAPPAPTAADALAIISACNTAGCPELAEELVAAQATLDQVQARLTAKKAERIATQARTDQITAMCATAKQPDLAAGYIAGGMATDAVRAHLTLITAKLDKAEIDGGLDPDRHPGSKASVDRRAAFKNFNQTAF